MPEKTEEFQETGIFDCRGKEKILVKRYGGDVAIRVVGKGGKILFESWFELKKPAKVNYEKLLKTLSNIRSLLVCVQR